MTTKDDDVKLQTLTAQITSVVANTYNVRKTIADTLNNITPSITELEGVISLLTIAATTCKNAKISYDEFIGICSIIYDVFEQVDEFEEDIGEKKISVLN